MSTFVHLIADYGAGDPAFSEVAHRLRHEDPEITVQPTEVEPLSTVATGFWIAQLGLHNPVFEDLMVYSNTAPRTEETTPGRSDEGGQLCYLELDNGVPVVAVEAGYNLSFVRDHVREFRVVETPADAGQFRSRDVFPERVVALANGDRDSLGESLSTERIPPRPERTVCHVDGYGNVKTSVRWSEFDPAEEVTVELNGVTRDVAVRDGASAVAEDSLGLIPGSAGGEDPYVALFLRGGSAAAAFDGPRPGDTFRVA